MLAIIITVSNKAEKLQIYTEKLRFSEASQVMKIFQKPNQTLYIWLAKVLIMINLNNIKIDLNYALFT